MPGYLRDPQGPLTIRWPYLPKAAPWLLRYVLSGSTETKVRRTAQALRTLLVDAPALHQKLAGETGAGHLIKQSGLLHIYPSQAEFEADALAWRIRSEVGIRWLELPQDELHRREPDLDSRYGFGVLVEEAGHCLNPGAYVGALISYAKANGAEFVSGRASGLRIEKGALRAVLAEGSEIACDAAVVAAGARSKSLARAAGIRCLWRPNAGITRRSRARRLVLAYRSWPWIAR